MTEPKSYNEVVLHPQREEWMEAMREEIESFKKNETWILCKLPPGRKMVGAKWVLALKKDQFGHIDRYKARLVAKGYSQQHGIDYDLVFAPVIKSQTFRISMSIASKQKMTVKHFDVKTAFLNGVIDEEFYMRQPPGFVEEGKEEFACLLNRSLYGLKQAARSWNLALDETLSTLGFKKNRADECLYHKQDEDGHGCYLLIYVDDIIAVSKSVTLIDRVKLTKYSKSETLVK